MKAWPRWNLGWEYSIRGNKLQFLWGKSVSGGCDRWHGHYRAGSEWRQEEEGEETGGQAAAEGIELPVASQTTRRSWLSLWVEGFEQSIFIDSRLKIDNRRTQVEIWKQVRSHCNNSHQKRRSVYWDDNAEWLVWGLILKVESTGSDVRWVWSVSQRKRKRMILKFWASKMGKTILFFEI